MVSAIGSGMAKAKWPTVWMVTDERMGEALWPALERLPRGSGILFRHYDAPDRHALAMRLAELAMRDGHALAVAGDVVLARAAGASLVHKPDGPAGALPLSLSVHSVAEAEEANRQHAALAFVSPLFATRSHPGQEPIDHREARRIVTRLRSPAIALGGMDAQRFDDLKGLGFHGWAGIDAWLRT
jgi:thiamine-phosphate pyrophosphorylase